MEQHVIPDDTIDPITGSVLSRSINKYKTDVYERYSIDVGFDRTP